MQVISLWPTVAAVLYFLGIILHYYHILAVFGLTKREMERSDLRTLFFSFIWPYSTVMIVIGVLSNEK
jgi:hypothetical protein|tara:strand:- start:144 stop:347 length:204 start_codon:yes stop_codon:yes gene_type:complete